MSIKDLNQVPPVSGAEIVYIPVEDIFPHPDNPRKDLGDLSELAESIKARGIMQNLTVVPREGNTYTAVIGHRRLAAAKLAGLSYVPCAVSHMDMQEQLATMITENVQRADLTAYEQAQAFGQLSMDFGMSAADISKQTGFSESTVRRRLKLQTLDDKTFKKVSDGRQISFADLEAVTDITDEGKRNEVLGKVGTADFSIKLKMAMKEQNERLVLDTWRSMLKAKGLTEIPQSAIWSNAWKSCVQKQLGEKVPTQEDADTFMAQWLEKGWTLGFGFYYGWLYIKRDAAEAEAEKVGGGASTSLNEAQVKTPEKTPEELAKERESALRRGACNRLETAFESAYELRRSFVDGMSEQKAKNALPAMVELSVCMLEIGLAYNDLSDEGMAAVRRRLENKPTAAAVYLLYYQLCDDASRAMYITGYPYDKIGEYNAEDSDREYLDVLYQGLVAMGYEMSDEERALLDGTSDLYYHEGYELPTESDEDTDEDTDDRPMTRLEAYRAMSDEELENELFNIDNYQGDLKSAIREGGDAEAVAMAVHSWFCQEPQGCEDASRYCEDCIAAWLNAEYKKEDK